MFNLFLHVYKAKVVYFFNASRIVFMLFVNINFKPKKKVLWPGTF